VKLFALTLSPFLFFSSLQSEQCPLCSKEVLEKQCVLETEYHRVLVDYMPRTKGHLLIVVKRHVPQAEELKAEEWAELSTIFPKIVGAFKTLLNTDQYLVLEKNGPNAFQQIPHVHFHLMPIGSQHWREIFDESPQKMNQETLEYEVKKFRDYFSNSK
jgi:histidine triad (HIT) family protein